MAVTIDQIQATLLSIISGMQPFSNYTYPQTPQALTVANFVLSDDGTIRDAKEKALKELGWAVTISPPLGARTVSQSCAGHTSKDNAGIASIDMVTVVSLHTDPKLNTGPVAPYNARPAQVPLLQTVGKIIKAVLSWKPSPGEKGFELITEHPLSPDFDDTGLFTYDIRFSKTIPIV